MHLDLSKEESALLAELLDADYRNLKEEIGKTEGYDYKEALKAREQLLVDLIEKLRQAPVE